jgi:murein DD-endopeptidase MepM/ murein hydrolase activator NlpD
MRLRVLLAVTVVPLVLFAVVPLPSTGQSGRISSLHNKIQEKREQVRAKRSRERALSRDISTYSSRINALQQDITVLQTREVRLTADLDRKRAELERIQADLRSERLRLQRLRKRLAESRQALATRLVELYKADRPDMVTVILEADGFADLLVRTEFMTRVSHQDARILDRVRTAKAEAVATEARLERLEAREQKLAAQILQRRDQVSEVKGQLVERRDGYAQVRSRRSTVLTRVRSSRRELEGHISSLEKESAAIAARLAAAQSAANVPAGPVRPGSGRFIWPVSGPLTSPFGMRWGRLHAGIDIGAAEGTPIRAAASGTVILLGWTGGYGNYTCVGHGGGYSTCYAHQSRYGTSNGAKVSQGQVIGYVGNTGNSFGAHLHFEVRVNGSPVNPAGYL